MIEYLISLRVHAPDLETGSTSRDRVVGEDAVGGVQTLLLLHAASHYLFRRFSAFQRRFTLQLGFARSIRQAALRKSRLHQERLACLSVCPSVSLLIFVELSICIHFGISAYVWLY